MRTKITQNYSYLKRLISGFSTCPKLLKSKLKVFFISTLILEAALRLLHIDFRNKFLSLRSFVFLQSPSTNWRTNFVRYRDICSFDSHKFTTNLQAIMSIFSIPGEVIVSITNSLISPIDLSILTKFVLLFPLMPINLKQIEIGPLDNASYRKTLQNHLFVKKCLFLPVR